MIEITDFRDRVLLALSAVPLGEDWCVALGGGDRPHIGAVAISQPRPSLADAAVTSATTSVVAVPGHKEDELARAMAARMASALGVVVTVSCGVHMDGATLETIATIKDLALEMTDNLIAEIQLHRSRQDQGVAPVAPGGTLGG
jgi:predicted amidohydrolase YtcJ